MLEGVSDTLTHTGSHQEREWREREAGLPHQRAEQRQAGGSHAV